MQYKILIVDDDLVIIEAARRILQEEYKVASAVSGKTAFQILDQMTPDLILLDINMPDMDGFAVLAQLKTRKDTKGIPVIFLTGVQGPETETKALESGAEDFVSKPFTASVLKRRIMHCIQIRSYQKYLETMVSAQTEAIISREKQVGMIQEEMIKAMANIIESRDGSTGGHVKRTSKYVELLVNVLRKEGYAPMELTEYYAEMLCRAAYMHDIGKINVDDEILRKPGRFTPGEYQKMKSHAANGGDIIRKTMSEIDDQGYVSIAADVATHHHERWDGTGYPGGLAGGEIPLGARIMALADVFDALTSVRCYKKGMTEDEAFSLMEKEAGKQFDPELISIMLANKNIFSAQLHEFMREWENSESRTEEEQRKEMIS